MYWWYKFIEKKGNVYKYAYSVDSDKCDGIICYSILTGEAVIEKKCENDDGEWMMHRSVEHFYKVVKEGFPSKVQVCTG